MHDQSVKITDKRTISLENENKAEIKQNTDHNNQNFNNKEMVDGLHKFKDVQMLSLEDLDSNELLLFFLNIIAQKAMHSLLSTSQNKRNFQEARRFIDLFEVILNFNSNKWPEPELEHILKMQLTELRLQYAKLAPSN